MAVTSPSRQPIVPADDTEDHGFHQEQPEHETGSCPDGHECPDLSPSFTNIGCDRTCQTCSTNDDQNAQHKPGGSGHQSIDANLCLNNLRHRDDSGIRQQLAQFRDQVTSGIFAASDDLDGTDHFARFCQFLHGVQMGEDSRIIDGAGTRQCPQHRKLATQHFDRITVREC